MIKFYANNDERRELRVTELTSRLAQLKLEEAERQVRMQERREVMASRQQSINALHARHVQLQSTYDQLEALKQQKIAEYHRGMKSDLTFS